VFNATILGQVFVNGVSLSAIYILVALGFTLLFGIMRVVNFAHGEFAMLGAFALFHLIKDLHWHWLIALPVGVLGVALASLVLEWLVFRWFYQRMFESMIGLLGLNMMMMFGAVLIWDVHERNIPATSSEVLMLGDIIVTCNRKPIRWDLDASLWQFRCTASFVHKGRRCWHVLWAKAAGRLSHNSCGMVWLLSQVKLGPVQGSGRVRSGRHRGAGGRAGAPGGDERRPRLRHPGGQPDGGRRDRYRAR